MPATTLSSFARAPLPPLVLLCLAATWLVWGSTYLAIKLALPEFPPFYMMGSRFLVAGLLLFAWTLIRRQPLPTPRQWLSALVVGTLMLGAGMGGVAHAEQTIGSGLVVAFIAVVPLMMAALNLLWGIRPGRFEWVGIGLGLIGVLMLTQGADFKASPSGLTAIIIATLSWSLGSVLSQRSLTLAPAAPGFASEMLCGGIVLMLLSWTQGETMVWPSLSLATAAWVYLVTFGSLIAFSAYMVLLSRASAALASSYTFVNPIIAMLLGVAVAHEYISQYEWLAAAVVLLGVVLMLAQKRH
ncbi:drug/metabolite exporter YedA [Paralcaligenes ureilyticus]|uniref:Threonine/homoserine efflux transporter RhtA n=1 Tax=Paralcaligenes ureilyticus TaxID=627131 RepID=A0A4V2UZ85_9BURK|nr:drug/metabolite exporter YedA [Paralcaligenes ureilyticus]TCT10288.1 threonine/homoserine efflux transporter RhtA [Paralcaligenes ureilyticus]